MKKFYLAILSLMLISFSYLYAQTTHTLEVLDYGNPTFSSQYNEIGYSIDGVIIEYNSCTAVPSIHVVILDSITCMPWNNCNNNFGQANIFTDPNGDCITDNNTIYTCRARPESIFIYRSNEPAQMQALGTFLNTITNGNYVLVYTFLQNTFSTMDPAFSSTLQNLGSTVVSTLPDSFPFVFFCKKGDVASVVETVGTHWEDTISISTTFECAASGINDLTTQSSLIIFPNPVSEELQVQMQHPSGSSLAIKGYDVLGNFVFESTTTDDVTMINTTELANGFYFIRVNCGAQEVTRKFCVMHE